MLRTALRSRGPVKGGNRTCFWCDSMEVTMALLRAADKGRGWQQRRRETQRRSQRAPSATCVVPLWLQLASREHPLAQRCPLSEKLASIRRRPCRRAPLKFVRPSQRFCKSSGCIGRTAPCTISADPTTVDGTSNSSSSLLF